MEPPHGLRNSSLLKAKMLRTEILSGMPSRAAGGPGLGHCLPFLLLTLRIKQQEPVFKQGFSSFLSSCLFLFFHKPFSIKPKIFLFLSLKPLTSSPLSCAGFSGSPGSPGYLSPGLLCRLSRLLLSLFTSFTMLCNFSVLIFTMRGSCECSPGHPDPASVPRTCQSLQASCEEPLWGPAAGPPGSLCGWAGRGETALFIIIS